MSQRIRNFRTCDRAGVEQLWQQVFADTSAHNAPSLSIDRKVEFDDGLFFVAASELNIIGTVMAGYDGHRGWIYSLAVLPSWQRRGIGSALVQAAEDALIALGCPKINLQVRRDNADVATFYESLGYEIENRISLGKRTS